MSKIFRKLNKHEKDLLDLVANSLFDCNKPIDSDSVDWERVWSEAYMQTVPMIAFSKVDKQVLGRSEFSYIKNRINKFFATATRVDFEHTRIHKLMSEAEVPYTVIKGFACSAYYPDPLMRAMGDIDFLVDPSYAEKAQAVLESNGFEPIKSTNDCHKVYTANGCRYELHYEPAGIPDGKTGNLIRSYLSDTVSTASELKTELGTIIVPDTFHHGLIILLHMCHHMTGEGIGLRHLCDWAVFVASLRDEVFCLIFRDRLKKAGLWQFACTVTRLCIEYLGCPNGKWATDANKLLVEQIMSDIFNGGNFGQKSPDRTHERLIMPSDNSNDSKASILRRLFISANQIVYTNWKISRKLKFLLPFGWIFFGGRYIIRSVIGKRPKIRPQKIAQEAVQRKNLYAQLKLFEADE